MPDLTLPDLEELKRIKDRQPRDAFNADFYASLITHALDAMREGRPYQINADGALANIQQAAQDRKDLAFLLHALPALINQIEGMRAALEPFERFYDLNDLDERHADDVIDVPVRDLRAAKQALSTEDRRDDT